MKPLELTVYAKTCSYPAGYVVPTGMMSGRTLDVIWAPKTVDAKARNKRLTDAELAAEYWCEEKSLGDVRDWIKTSPGYKVIEPVLLERVLTLHRFATLPHYDDPTETGSTR